MARDGRSNETTKAWRVSSNIFCPYLTPEEDEAAVLYYLTDPRKFMEKYLYIKTKDGRLVPFRLWRCQKIVYDIIMRFIRAGRPVRLIILKARQVGITSLIAALAYTFMRLKRNIRATIIAQKLETARESFYEKIEVMQASLPEELQPLEKEHTKNRLMLGNGDKKTALKHPGMQSDVSIKTAKTATSGRGGTYQIVAITEFAFYDQPRQALRAINQTIPSLPETIGVIETTSDGQGGFFHSEYMRALENLREGGDFVFDTEPDDDGEDNEEDRKNVYNRARNWYPIFLPYFLHEEYEDKLSATEEARLIAEANPYERALKQKFRTLTWGHIAARRRLIAEKCSGSELTFDLEYPVSVDAAFAATGQTIFSVQAIMWFMDNTVRPGKTGYLEVRKGMRVPKFVPSETGNLTIFAPPDPNDVYFIGADGAMGKSPEPGMDGEFEHEAEDDDSDEGMRDRDWCTAVVLNSRKEQVAEWRSQTIDPFSFADELINLAVYYNEAYILPETGGQGAGTGIQWQLTQNGYANLGRWTKLEHYRSDKKRTEYVGWETNWRSKSVLVGLMQREVLNGSIGLPVVSIRKDPHLSTKFIIRSKELCNELSTFAQHGDSGVGARAGSHDDLVIAAGLALLMWRQGTKPDTRPTVYTQDDVEYNQGGNDDDDKGWMYA